MSSPHLYCVYQWNCEWLNIMRTNATNCQVWSITNWDVINSTCRAHLILIRWIPSHTHTWLTLKVLCSERARSSITWIASVAWYMHCKLAHTKILWNFTQPSITLISTFESDWLSITLISAFGGDWLSITLNSTFGGDWLGITLISTFGGDLM